VKKPGSKVKGPHQLDNAEGGGGVQQRHAKVMLLPVKRSQNVGVFMSRLKMTTAKASATSLPFHIALSPSPLNLNHA
jgi:hypothetical protein